MAKMAYSRNDIADLCKRMEARAGSPLLRDQPELQRDIRAMSLIVRHALSIGFPVQPIEIDSNGNG
jgi:hypothetical protein